MMVKTMVNETYTKLGSTVTIESTITCCNAEVKTHKAEQKIMCIATQAT